MAGVDEKLLSNNSSGDGSEGQEAGNGSGSDSGNKGKGADLAASFIKAGGNPQKMAMDMAMKSAKDPSAMIGQASGKLLKSAWMNLIPSFGSLILYVDFHYFLNKVLGDKAFTKPGHEWAPPMPPIGGDAKKTEEMGKRLELVENCGCCAVNGGCFLLLVLAMTIVYAIIHPVDFGIDLAK